ncbi:hypothetical protein C3B44_10790 [Corynebacterium yudongzhengii]|uniref:YoaR-like putative peptidoglycan binding domain-containing protein n=1 Tax=Corynebacterium yudongzhengii TaxID=2080740 RepID=A0A2U1T891_9CORY|nr:hypothetical protein C3B44_10790 [Corynebacterium yudongzhengii]PWC02227.1 hypothetical protein DF222_03605 [Corynebacterium yudongzhengii]
MTVILGGLYAWDYLSNKDNVPRGTTVGGVEIGGMSHAEAEEKLRTELGGVETDPVTVAAGEESSQLIPAEAGLSIDWQATIAQAGEESANPIERLRGLLSSQEVPVVSQTDEQALSPELDRVTEELSTEAEDGAVTIENGKPVTKDPVNGQTVEREELHLKVTENWLDPEGVEVEPQVVEPRINDDVITATIDGPLGEALDGPLTIHGEGGDGVIPQERLGEVISTENAGETIDINVNDEAAQAIFAEQLAETETPPQNAKLNQDGSVVPHEDGRVIDWEVTMEDFSARVVGDADREWDAAYKDKPAEYTTEEAENATFDQVIGEFTTSDFSQTSGQNIAVIANQINGVIVNPGETFSVNQFTGPRGTAQGYVEGGTIENGRAGTAVGGGISQFATTLYNATYFAGMEDVAHTPHSYYIPRYPAGREATLYEGAIDLVFRNSNSNPVRIDTEMGSNSITVKIRGVKEVNVESIDGGRWAYTEPDERRISGDDCIPSSGNKGFTTSDTRVISDLDGNEISRETQTTVYDPQPIVRCG